jgi:hypothetical protein
MFRLASLVGFVALTVAAAALAKQSQNAKKEPRRDEDRNDDAYAKVPAVAAATCPAFHARFSLN